VSVNNALILKVFSVTLNREIAFRAYALIAIVFLT